MNSTRIAIGVAMLMIVSATALVICDSDYTEAATVDGDSIRYNSDIGFELDVGEVDRTFALTLSGTSGTAESNSGPWSVRVDSDGTYTLESTRGEIDSVGNFDFEVRALPGGTLYSDSVYILEILFDSNNGTDRTSSVFLSEGYTGYELPEGFGWTDGGQTIIGWSTTPNGDVEYDLREELPTFTRGMTSDDVLTLYAVYGEVRQTNVTIGVNDPVMGSVSQSTVTVPVGSEISVSGNTITIDGNTITATANDGYEFVDWSVDDGDSVTAGMSISAQFKQIVPENITVNFDSENGTVFQGSISVPIGSTVTAIDGESITVGRQTVTASPGDDPEYTYKFDGWYIGDTEVAVDTVVEDGTTITAKYTMTSVGPGPDPEYRVTVLVNDPFMGTASANVTMAGDGDTVTLSYETNNGYRFVRWASEDVTIEGNNFVMPAHDVTVTAVFEVIPPTEYTINVYQAEHGTASASHTTATAGTLITLTANPDDGYVLDHWVINDEDHDGNTFRMPEGDVTVTPVFRALEVYQVTVDISGNGSVFLGTEELADGSLVNIREQVDLMLTYTAGEDNYTVNVEVSDSGARVYNSNGTLTVSGISQDCTVTIEFVQGYMVTVDEGDHGEVLPGTALQPENATVTYTVRPDAGYAVDRVLVDGQEVAVSDNEFRVQIGTSAHTISVEYVYVGVIDDGEEEYVPPVITVIPGDDDSTTTYIVAIAAGVVVAILAALILMQTRKS